MKKIDAELLVCSSMQANQLIMLGILPAACFCYEFILDKEATEIEGRTVGFYEFAGEYMGQDSVIPAWTYDELYILIGPEIPKPEMFKEKDWSMTANMMQWALMLPKKRSNYPCGAMAAAGLLEWLLINKHITPDEANGRLEAFITKKHYNPAADELEGMRK